MNELLAPASTIEKAILAFENGADAIYIGLNKFSLRKRASNIDFKNLKNLVENADKIDKKVYVTSNIIPKNSDLKDVKKFFKSLKKTKVHGVILSSLYFIKVARKIGLNVFISTQLSATNSYAIKYYEKLNAKRVILARELTLDDIKDLKSNIELEIFIHGGCCMSYSGRCILSNIMTKRDANRGDCAHSCRWIYKLYDDGKKISDKEFSLSSKDLKTISYINEILKLKNVQSYKIEGRMKSENYLATIINIYRYLIDNSNNLKENDFYMLEKEILTAGGREYVIWGINNDFSNNTQIYKFIKTSPKQNFIALVIDYDDTNKRCYVKCKNKFYNNSKAYLFSKNGKSEDFIISNLCDEKNNHVEFANHPEEVYSFKLDMKCERGNLLKIIYE